MIDAVAAAMDAFHFLRPAWLLGFAGLPLLVVLWRWRGRRESPWAGVVDESLQPHVLEADGSNLPRMPWRALLVFVLGVLALAGPAWRSLPVEAFGSSDALVVVVDLSSASRAADLQPDRTTRARLKLVRLIERREGGLLGLAVFAGGAHTVSPLTADSATLRQLVDALDPGLMPVDGHRPDLAIRHARDLLHKAGHQQGRILLLTDRSDARAAAVATEVRAEGFEVHVLGVGHVDGAPVRDSAGGFERGPGGDVRVVRLDPASLEALARAGGGRYRTIEPGDGDLESLGVLVPDGPGTTGEALSVVHFRDEGFWLLLPMLLLMLPGFRRGELLAFVLGVGLALPPSPLQAAEPEALWQRPDQRAYRALGGQDYERARALARDPMIRGAAAFRLGAHGEAAEAFGEAGGADGLYNRGNALAADGQYEEALSAWRDAIAIDPTHPDAEANLEALQAWLDQQPPQSQPGPADEGGDPGAEGDAPEDGDGTAQSEEGEASDGPESRPDDSDAGEPEPGERGDGRDQADAAEGEDGGQAGDPDAESDAERAVREAIEQALAEQAGTGAEELAAELDAEALESREREEAIERWLRLVEDDPGALLRRKFMIEHQRRLRGEAGS